MGLFSKQHHTSNKENRKPSFGSEKLKEYTRVTQQGLNTFAITKLSLNGFQLINRLKPPLQSKMSVTISSSTLKMGRIRR
jgi:hypothetical protein